MFEKLVLKLAKRMPFSFPQKTSDSEIRALVAQLANPRGLEDAVEGIEIEDRIRSLGVRSIPALVEFLEKWGSTNRGLLMTALKFLEPFHSPAIVPSLSSLVNHGDAEIREEVARALGNVCSDECIPLLKIALADREYRVAQAAVFGMCAALQSERGSNVFRAELFEHVGRLIGTRCSVQSVAHTLILMNRNRSIPLVIEHGLKPGNSDQQLMPLLYEWEAEIPIDMLKQMMSRVESMMSEFYFCRHYGRCLAAMGRSSEVEARSFLERAASDKRPIIRDHAAIGLAYISGVGNIEARLSRRLKSAGLSNLSDDERCFLGMIQMVGAVRQEGATMYARPLNPDGSEGAPRLITGLESYLEHSASDLFQDAKRGLRLIGATATADILDQASLLFGESGPDIDGTKRNAQIYHLTADKKQSLQLLGLQLMKEPDSIIPKLHDYVVANRDNYKGLTGKLD